MPLHTVSTLSIKIGLAEGRIINILKYEYKLEGALRTDSPIPELQMLLLNTTTYRTTIVRPNPSKISI